MRATVPSVISRFSWSDTVAVSVVLASAGYPGSYEGKEITGIEAAQQLEERLCYHAGTAQTEDGKIVTMAVAFQRDCALLSTRRALVHTKACDLISFEDELGSGDIGLKDFKVIQKIIEVNYLWQIKMTVVCRTIAWNSNQSRAQPSDVFDDMQSTEPEILDADMQANSRGV